MSDAPRDFLERARLWPATGMVIAGALMILGSALDWVSIAQLPDVIPTDQRANAEPFNGFDVGDGYWTAGAGLALMIAAVGVVIRGRHAWAGILAAIVGGGIAISDYRGIESLFERSSAIGSGITVGPGLTLVAAGALVGLVSSVTAKAATPRRA